MDPQYQQYQQQQYEQQEQEQDQEQELLEDEDDLDLDLEQDPTIDRSRIFGRAQAALSNQLEKERNRYDLQVREKREEVNRAQKKREAIGVDLYGMQQQLAKLQMSLEATHERHAILTRLRSQAEHELSTANQIHASKSSQRVDMEKKMTKAQKELDALKLTLKQVDEYNDRMRSEIQVTKRIAYAAEDDIKKTEMKKNEQDLLIDNLNEQIKQLAEQSDLYSAQFTAQQAETRSAAAMLAEATREMGLIAAEKKEYLTRWKASLLGMAKRDEALKAAESALSNQEERQQALQAEIAGYKQSIRTEQETNERLTGTLSKVQAESAFVQQQLVAINERKKKLSGELAMLRASLEKSDRDLKLSALQEKDLRSSILTLEKHIQKLSQDRQSLEDKMLESLSQQMTLEKGAQNVLKEGSKLRAMAQEKEQKLADLQNEVARIKVDALNTAAHNKELRATLDECLRELNEKQSLIDKYENEIKSRHDEIEKKQIYVDRLNRKFDSLVSNMEDENTGPLEATIKNLQKEIANRARESSELQKSWIKGQTELVELVNATQTKREAVSQLASTETILGQKKMRIASSNLQQLGEIRELNNAIRNMHTDMTRLNELIAKNTQLQEELTNATFHMENDFVHRLKEQQSLSAQMEIDITKCLEEKQKLLEDILEAERQVMLWEKKIILEKETQEALDPEYGQSEVSGMKKEIHRMQLRLQQLKRKQEVMMQEMERAIEKREMIETRNITSKSKAVTQASLKQKTMTLKTSLKQQQQETRAVESDILRQEQDNQILAEQVERLQQEYNSIEDVKFDLSSKMDERYLQKQMNMERLQMLQKRAKRFESALQGAYNPSGNREELVEQFSKSVNRLERLKAVFGKLREENPKYDHFFDQLLAFCSE